MPRSIVLVLWVGLLTWQSSALWGAPPSGTESREFTILVDDKPAGSFGMTITLAADGTTTMAGRAGVLVQSLLVFKYEYSYQGTETWKDGILQRAESASNDDGKKMDLSVVCKGETCQVSANGKRQNARIPAWTSTYWCLPRPEMRGQELTVLDVDTGLQVRAKLQLVEKAKLNLAGAVRECTHYRLTGGAQADLWFDDQDRLCKQISLEDGHRTEWRLARLVPARPDR